MVGKVGGTILLSTGTSTSIICRVALTFNRVIILLATPLTHLSHFDIDTSHFSGNEAPASQVFALRLDKPSNSTLDGAQAKWNILLSPSDKRWEEVLPVVKLGPDSRHIFEIGKKGQEGIWNAVMVRMIPDGGMVSHNSPPDAKSDCIFRHDSEHTANLSHLPL